MLGTFFPRVVPFSIFGLSETLCVLDLPPPLPPLHYSITTHSWRVEGVVPKSGSKNSALHPKFMGTENSFLRAWKKDFYLEPCQLLLSAHRANPRKLIPDTCWKMHAKAQIEKGPFQQERDPFTDLRRLLQSSDLTLTGMLSDLDWITSKEIPLWHEERLLKTE